MFVHGLGASWQSWLENIPEFARDHRVVAMDLPGFGYSDAARRGHLDRVLRELDLPRCSTSSGSTPAAVVGNSMGGFIAAEMAIRSPERVQRLAVVSAAVFWQSYRRAQPLVGLARLSDAIVARALDARHRRCRDAAAAALVGARHGRLPLPAR